MQLPECRTCIKLGTKCEYKAVEGIQYVDKDEFRNDIYRMLITCIVYWRVNPTRDLSSSSPGKLLSLFNTLWNRETSVDLPKPCGYFENERLEKTEGRPWDSALSIFKPKDDEIAVPDSMLGLMNAELQILTEHNAYRLSRGAGRRASRHQRGGGGSSDYWSGASTRRSRAGSAVSSMNSSLHGYDIYDPEEQTMDIGSSRLFKKELSPLNRNKMPSSTFQLPPPPVELSGSQMSFECDICRQMISLARKREWR